MFPRPRSSVAYSPWVRYMLLMLGLWELGTEVFNAFCLRPLEGSVGSSVTYLHIIYHFSYTSRTFSIFSPCFPLFPFFCDDATRNRPKWPRRTCLGVHLACCVAKMSSRCMVAPSARCVHERGKLSSFLFPMKISHSKKIPYCNEYVIVAIDAARKVSRKSSF